MWIYLDGPGGHAHSSNPIPDSKIRHTVLECSRGLHQSLTAPNPPLRGVSGTPPHTGWEHSQSRRKSVPQLPLRSPGVPPGGQCPVPTRHNCSAFSKSRSQSGGADWPEGIWGSSGLWHQGKSGPIGLVMVDFCVNLSGLQCPAVWSNTSLDVAVKVFVDMTCNQLTLCKVDNVPWHGGPQ